MTTGPDESARGREYPPLEDVPSSTSPPEAVDYPDAPAPPYAPEHQQPGYPPPAYPPPVYPQAPYPQPYQGAPGYGYGDPTYGPASYGAPSGGVPSYGTAPYDPYAYGGYPPPRPPGTNGKAIASLVTSLAGLTFCGLPSIVGLILGIIAMRECKRTGQEGHGMALAGVIIGALATLLFVVVVIVYAIGITAALNDPTTFS
jgi:Domain of unknown function (DUF4190)